MFEIVGQTFEDPGNDMHFTSLSNDILWSIETKGGDYQLLAEKQVSEEFVTLAQASIKVGPNMKPNLLETSESGIYVVLSFSDYHYKNGEVYVAELSQKMKVSVERIKKLEKPLSSICFQPIYNDEYGNSEARESFDESPEFLLGTSIGEIFVGELIRKKIRLQFLKSMRASTYMSFEGNDCNAVRCIEIINISNKSRLVFPEMKQFFTNPVFDKVNISIIVLCCGIVCEMFVECCSSLWQLVLDESTSFEFHELQNLAVGENIPLFEYFRFEMTTEKMQFFWVVESFVGKNIALQKIVFDFSEIMYSACLEIVKACGLSERLSGQLDSALSKLAALPEFPPSVSLLTIRGIEQLRGAMLDLKTEDAILGIWVTEYHLLIVLSSQITIVNLISEEKTGVLNNMFAEPFQQHFSLRTTANRADNYTAFENCQVVGTGCRFVNFGDIFVKKCEFPAACSEECSYVNALWISSGFSKEKEAEMGFLKAGDETVNLWRCYLAQEDFDNAMRFSRSVQDENVIKREQAAHCLSKGDGVLAAQLFAESDCNMVVKFQELVKLKKFDVCTHFMEERLRLVFDKYESFKKPVEYAEDKLDQMDLVSREDYYAAYKDFEEAQQTKCLAVQLYIESLIVAINCLQSDQERQSVDLYAYYGISGQFSGQKISYVPDKRVADELVLYKSQLTQFITKKDTPYYSYILKNILENSLINSNLDYIYAEYCTSTNDADFTINYHIERQQWDDAVANLRNASNEQFLAYLDRIIEQRPRECFELIEYKIESMRGEFRFNVLYPILRQHMFVLKEFTVDFCRWLCFDFKAKNELSIAFIINSLAQLNEESLLLQILKEMADNGVKIDLMYVLQISRSRKLRNLEADCLYRLGRPTDALELQFKTFNSINAGEIKNIETSEKNEIYFGELEKVFDSFMQLEGKMALTGFEEDRRALYLDFFKWFMGIEIVMGGEMAEDKQAQLLHQIRYRELQRIFALIEAVPFLTQLDGIQQIPKFFNVAITRELTNDLALFNQARAAQVESVISSAAEVLEANELQIAQQSRRVVSVYGGIRECQYCRRLISTHPDEYVNIGGVTVFPCGHCWHGSCFVRLQYSKGKHGAKDLIERWRAFERDNPGELYTGGAEIIEELAKKCPKCSDESIDRCLDPI